MQGFMCGEDTVDTFNPNQQGSLLNLQQELALDALANSAAGRPLDSEVFSTLMRFSKDFATGLLAVPDFEQFLLRVAAEQPSPRDVRDNLWKFVQTAETPLDLSRLMSMRILSAGVEHLSPDERSQLVTAVALIKPPTVRIKYVAEILGLLGAHGIGTDDMIESLSNALVLQPLRPTGTPLEENPPVTKIESSDEPAGIALAQLSLKRLLTYSKCSNRRPPASVRWRTPTRHKTGPLGPKCARQWCSGFAIHSRCLH
jgi:hypothetical protein